MKGVKIATANCGIKYKHRDDLLFVAFENEANVAGVFTQSSMSAAPVNWCKKIIKHGKAKGLIVNAGNANAFTGKEGEIAVDETAKKAANILGCDKEEIFISSTGVIGERLKHELITEALDKMSESFSTQEEAFDKAAKAIMTTDTKEKIVKKICKIGNLEVSLIGFAKGSGMIAPNMATMLGYIFTDANISSEVLSSLLKDSANKSFNSITVDSDQSTNDTVLLFATKEIFKEEISNLTDSKLSEFKKALDEICLELAKMIVVDGEGATKLIEVEVTGAQNETEAKRAALSIANSPLVKTAIAGADPNWGRIIMAIGKSEVETAPEKVSIQIGEYLIVEKGSLHPNYVEKEVHKYLKGDQVKIAVDLGNGENKSTVWTCDLTEGYIKINKDYRS